jgi:PAS domain S-box-containing protein
VRVAERTVWASLAGTGARWSKLTRALLLACSFLICVSASSIYLVISSQSSQETMDRALRLENRLLAIRAFARIAESEQRGYLLTGDPVYLEIYGSTVGDGMAAVADVKAAVAKNPAQQRAIAEIESLLVRKFEELQETIRLHDAGDHAGALALVRTGVGRDLMTRIRAATARLTDEQRRLVSLRTSNSVSTNIWLLLANLAGLALIVVLAAISVLIVRRASADELARSESRADELGAAVEQRRKIEQKFREVLEAAPDAMVVVNQQQEIALMNFQAEKQFGYHRVELLGQKIASIIPDGFAERLLLDGLRSSADVQAQQIGTGVELIGKRKDGAEFPVEIMLTPLGSTEGMMTTVAIRDISARKQSERLKDEFISTVSHELRTPLTSISGSLGLLAERWASEFPKSAARLLAIAHSNSLRLVRLVNDILDIEKFESSRVAFNLSRVDLASLLLHAIEENRGYAESCSVSVRLDSAPAGSDVSADPDRLAQVVTNLLSNAIKFSPEGGEVLIAAEIIGDVIRVSVRDHGCGIPDDFKPHVFEKFTQADGTTSRQKGGTGLGLSIVKHIVERLGGDVGFDNAPGGGTVFHVDLQPWDDTVAGEVDLSSEPGVVRILLCEDDREAAIALRKALRRIGYAVDFASTMSAGVARTNTTRYGAILVDLKLPDGDGMDLIRQIRAGPHDRDTPVIVISRDPDRGRRDIGSSHLNVLDWLSKPLDFERLALVLAAALAPWQRERLRVLHVDDDHDVLALVTYALRAVADVIPADSFVSARRALATERIDVVVLDLAIGDESGMDLLPELRDSLGNSIPVIIFATNGTGVPCDAQIQIALSKSNASLEHLRENVRDRLALLAKPPIMEAV